MALGISLSTETVRTQFISIKNTLICPNFCRTVGNLSVSVQEREPLYRDVPVSSCGACPGEHSIMLI